MNKAKGQHLASWIFGGTSFLFLMGVFLFGPNELPPQKHLILGLFAAFAAGLLGYFLTGSVGLQTSTKLPVLGKVVIKAAGGAALFIIVLFWWNSDRSPVKKIDAKLDEIKRGQANQPTKDDLAQMQKAILEAIAPKAAGDDRTNKQLPPELLEKARVLLERGDQAQKALALIALKDHSGADKIIQELKKEPLDELFDVYLLEGDNWYGAGEFDRAIEPYEKCVVLKPNDLQARNDLSLAHTFARLGSIADHCSAAIKIAEGTLKLVAENSTDWAMAQNSLGIAWRNMPTGDQEQNLRKAIAAYEAALTVYTNEAAPANWAMTQNNLGSAWDDMPTGDREQNLKKAIAAYEAALTVYTREAAPFEWAGTQNNLGAAWSEMPTGDPEQNLQKAVAGYEAALTVYTKEAAPADWAMTQNNLGVAWVDMPTGDREQNLRKAIAAYEAALTIYTRNAAPADWARTQNNLGGAWDDMPAGDREQNLRKAIAAYEAALTIRTREAAPFDWAATQNDLGVAWRDMPTGDREQNLRNAIGCTKAALGIFTAEAFPIEHKEAMKTLDALRREYGATAAATTRPFDSLDPAQ